MLVSQCAKRIEGTRIRFHDAKDSVLASSCTKCAAHSDGGFFGMVGQLETRQGKGERACGKVEH